MMVHKRCEYGILTGANFKGLLKICKFNFRRFANEFLMSFFTKMHTQVSFCIILYVCIRGKECSTLKTKTQQKRI